MDSITIVKDQYVSGTANEGSCAEETFTHIR